MVVMRGRYVGQPLLDHQRRSPGRLFERVGEVHRHRLERAQDPIAAIWGPRDVTGPRGVICRVAVDAHPATMKRTWGPPPAARNGKVIDLERYAPACLTFVANRLGRGASRNYLRV